MSFSSSFIYFIVILIVSVLSSVSKVSGAKIMNELLVPL